MQAVPSSGKTNSTAEMFYKRSFCTKLPTLAYFYDPLEATTTAMQQICGGGEGIVCRMTIQIDGTTPELF
jgi:hypothetical protein